MTESEIDQRTGRGRTSTLDGQAADPSRDGGCGECGEQSPPGATFCVHCRSYLGWGEPASDRPGSAERPAEGGPTEPETPPPPDADRPARPGQGPFRINAATGRIAVPATGEPAVLSITVTNLSPIVDGYQVAPVSAPSWLVVDADQPRLLPSTEGALAIRFRAVAPGLVAAQRLRVMLAVRSLSQAPAQVELPVEVTVSAIDLPVRLRAEPRLLRLRDDAPGTFTVSADNPGNRTVRLRLSGSDPELAVRFSFRPEVLQLGPGASGSVQVTATAPGPQDEAEISRQLSITAGDGVASDEVPVTMRQLRSVPAMTALAVRIEPSLIRVRDADGAHVTVILDNRRGRAQLRVTLEGRDAEQAMRLSFAPPMIDVPPGEQVPVRLQLDAWRPQPGNEVTRPFTVVASDGRTSLETTGTLVHSSSRSAMDTLGVRLEPSVIRLTGRGRGSLTAVVDNRGGAQPVHVRLAGADPEGVVRFGLSPAELDVAAGQIGRSTVTVRCPRTSAGQQVAKPFTVLASDGRAEASATGSLVPVTSNRRPVARVIWTLLGSLAMAAGASGTWLAGAELTGTELVPSVFGFHRGLGVLGSLSVGHAMIALGLLAILGLFGAKGRLTRFAALAGLLGVIAVIGFAVLQWGGDLPGPGVILATVGCVAAYVGGRTAPR